MRWLAIILFSTMVGVCGAQSKEGPCLPIRECEEQRLRIAYSEEKLHDIEDEIASLRHDTLTMTDRERGIRMDSVTLLSAKCRSALAEMRAELREMNCPAPAPLVDTTGIASFWHSFQWAVKNDRRSDVAAMLQYPMHEILIAEFNFSVTCDTTFFARTSELHANADITPENVQQRYPFLFTKELKDMIAHTDIAKIVDKGHHGTRHRSITYVLFAKDYGYGCGSDIALHVHFHHNGKQWTLSMATA